VPSSVNPFRTLARHRNFRLFWFGQTLSLVGTWMQVMAQGWLALQLTNSAFLVGLVASAGSFPILLFSFHAGVVADRFNKLHLVRICQALLAFEAAALWWLTWSGDVTIGWLIALAALNGLFSAFEIPARQSLVIELVGRDDLPGAIALNSSGFNLARVIGPSIGALVMASLGVAWCFGINTLSYAAVLASLFLMRLPAWSPPEHRASPWQGIVEGIRYMRDTPAIAGLMKLVTAFSILGIPFIVLMPVVARDQLGLGAGGYGVMLASVGVGGLAGALTLAAVGDRFSRRQILLGSSTGFAALLVVFSLVHHPVVAYVVLLLIGFTMIVNSALCNAVLQHSAPDALRGRMMAAYSFVVVGLSQVVGSFVAGAIAHASSAGAAIGLGGVVLLVYTYVAFARRTELRNV
jgi:MFS family permease